MLSRGCALAQQISIVGRKPDVSSSVLLGQMFNSDAAPGDISRQFAADDLIGRLVASGRSRWRWQPVVVLVLKEFNRRRGRSPPRLTIPQGGPPMRQPRGTQQERIITRKIAPSRMSASKPASFGCHPMTSRVNALEVGLFSMTNDANVLNTRLLLQP